MFVALKNWRERLKHKGSGHHRLLAGAERMLETEAGVSIELLQDFRAAALAPDVPHHDLPALEELGAQFVDAEPLSTEQNLSIMASVEQGAARRTRRR